ncbi:uncharacterized protein METZ01_LOCUS349960, partial [marine metagenome]
VVVFTPLLTFAFDVVVGVLLTQSSAYDVISLQTVPGLAQRGGQKIDASRAQLLL